ncbi:MAG TPA: type II toxin-antitoxin system VapC family toxin [Tepidisphaeraceae bacterium]|jgi:predicted nucleic acid-binding protein|nr:type II toxin-antitoxin system VapC family toxin [Tepidisphaeraceae bacterium]
MALDLPDGAACFVDSNILYYALVPTLVVSEHCLALLERAIASRISLSVSAIVLSDVLHKVMTSEAAQLAKRDRIGIVGYLGKHPEFIARLTEYPLAIERLSSVPMNMLSVDAELLRNTTRLAIQHHLLTNDAMIVALMRRHQLIRIKIAPRAQDRDRRRRT